jgi:hypothetical protein
VLEALAELRLPDAPGRAAALLAHAAAIRTAIGAPVPACERPGVAAAEATVRALLGGGYAAAARAGREAELDTLLTADELPDAARIQVGDLVEALDSKIG